MELIKERHEGPVNEFSELSLAQIPDASMAVLVEIIKNPQLWSKDAVEIAEAEILRRENNPSSASSHSKSSSMNPFMKAILAVFAMIGAFIFLKLIAILMFFAFLFYSIESCLHRI